LTVLVAGPAAVAQEAPLPAGAEVQARGPIHEAFAQPSPSSMQPGAVIARQPPEPVPEEPPDVKPEGANVQWVPGYWAWDADRNNFLWVSGVWRDAPPGQTYVAGYWAQDGTGWRWVPGFWVDGQRQQLNYDPAPPASLEAGPAAPAPEEGTVYTPGSWVYRQTRYVWRPGYWMVPRPGMVWVPPHYVWTPLGYLFIPGYWDYPLEARGVLFAPVYFRQPWNVNPGWVYRPSYVIRTRPLLTALFVGPGAVNYYFGDYYRAAGPGGRFQPWYAYGPHRYDPLYTYYSFQHRNDPTWAAGLKQVYVSRAAGTTPVPPRTLQQQTAVKAGGSAALVTALARYRPPGLRLAPLSAAQRRAVVNSVRTYRTAAVTRRQVETKAGGRPGGATLNVASVTHTTVRSQSLPPPAARGPGVQVKTTTAKEVKTQKGPNAGVKETRPSTTEVKKGPNAELKKETRTTTEVKKGPHAELKKETRTSKTEVRTGPGAGKTTTKETQTKEIKKGPPSPHGHEHDAPRPHPEARSAPPHPNAHAEAPKDKGKNGPEHEKK
jgi:hypothetical protein